MLARFIKYVIWIFLICSMACLSMAETRVKIKPVVVKSISREPNFDGRVTDEVWQTIDWQPINQVWIPYGQEIPAADYSGQFKIAWSPETSLLYFLVEIHDDVFMDGFDPANAIPEVYQFDIIEIFIDPDHSGGLHVFNGTGETAAQWGANAENAFAHHIYASFPDSGKVTTACFSGDMSGTGWDNRISKNYANHFDSFALRCEDNTAVWELSLKVYSDTYDDSDPEASRVQLKAGMEMGISLAYCDNDNPDEKPIERDHFFGSVHVEKKAYNDHWMNADDFGVMVLSK